MSLVRIYSASGQKFWKRWYCWATPCRLEPMYKAAATIRRHSKDMLIDYHHSVTNAMGEGLNSQIQKIRH